MKIAMPVVECKSAATKTTADALVIPVIVEKDKPDFKSGKFGKPIDERISELSAGYHGSANTGAIDAQMLPKSAGYKRVALLCISDKGKLTSSSVRNAAGQMTAWCRQNAVGRVAVCLDAISKGDVDDHVAGFVEGVLLASFRYGPDHKDSGKPDQDLKKATLLVGAKDVAKAKKRIKDSGSIAEGVNLARFLGHEPPNVIHPESLATRCQQIARLYKLKCKIIDDKAMKRDKMGAFLAVGQGSASKPRMIILEHLGGASAKGAPIVLVGKAVTLDTGGYSIKPGASIPDMKYDKQGGMAVIGTLVAASLLGLKRRIVGIVGAAENMISGEAYRPGDIIQAYNGKTVEVLNTDAEGRLVLADCLHYGEKTFKPAAMIDLATLTGAVEVALGNVCAGLFSPDDKLADELLNSANRTDEKLWRLPLWPEYRELIVANDADIKNVGGRAGGSITAGMFLKEFVTDKTRWAHLDIAGTATVSKQTPICPIGATGFGVRLLIDYLQNN